MSHWTESSSVRQATLKDLCEDDKAKVGELVKMYATEKLQRRTLEHRAIKDIKALKREIQKLKHDNCKFLKEKHDISREMDSSACGKENLHNLDMLETTSKPRKPLDDYSQFNASQLKTAKPRNKTVERGCSPAKEPLCKNASKPSQYCSYQATELAQPKLRMKEVSTSPLKERTPSQLNRSVLVQTVQDAGTQTRTPGNYECRPLVLSDEQRAVRKTKPTCFRSSDETFGCRTDRKVDSSRTDKSQDTTRDQTIMLAEAETAKSRSLAINEVKSLKEDILSLSMNLRQLRTSRSMSSSKRESGDSAKAPLDSSRRSPIDIGPLQPEHLKLILDKVHCRGCCQTQEIVTSKRNPLNTPSSHGRSKSPGQSFNTSRGRRTSSSLFATRDFEEAELSNRSMNGSNQLRALRPYDLYDDNLYSLIAELEQLPTPSSTQLSVLEEDDELDYSDFSCFNSASKVHRSSIVE